MKIEKLETVWIDAQPNTLWLRIHTDDGRVGLGETFYAPRAVAAIIHDVLARLLIGQPAFAIEAHWTNMFATVNFFGFAGAETRAISAVDIALWDLYCILDIWLTISPMASSRKSRNMKRRHRGNPSVAGTDFGSVDTVHPRHHAPRALCRVCRDWSRQRAASPTLAATRRRRTTSHCRCFAAPCPVRRGRHSA